MAIVVPVKLSSEILEISYQINVHTSIYVDILFYYYVIYIYIYTVGLYQNEINRRSLIVFLKVTF